MQKSEENRTKFIDKIVTLKKKIVNEGVNDFS